MRAAGGQGVYSHWEWKLPIKNSPFNWELLLKHYLFSTAGQFLVRYSFFISWKCMCFHVFTLFQQHTYSVHLYLWSEAHVNMPVAYVFTPSILDFSYIVEQLSKKNRPCIYIFILVHCYNIVVGAVVFCMH